MDKISQEDLLENLADGIYYVDMNKNITYWNKSAERISGFKKSEVLGKCCADNILRHIDNAGHQLCIEGCPLSQTLIDGKTRESNVYLHHKKGHRVPVSVKVSPIRDKAGSIIGAVESFSDNTTQLEMLKDFEKLKNDAYIDNLTNISNRRYAENILDTNFTSEKKFSPDLGIIYFDVDHFKNINDTYGHDIGDEVLIMVAKTVANVLRKQDTISRWGGEEFVVVLPNANKELLNEIAERIRKFVELSFIIKNNKKITVTISLGVTFALESDTKESLIKRADELMYHSKTHGRNQITFG